MIKPAGGTFLTHSHSLTHRPFSPDRASFYNQTLLILCTLFLETFQIGHFPLKEFNIDESCLKPWLCSLTGCKPRCSSRSSPPLFHKHFNKCFDPWWTYFALWNLNCNNVSNLPLSIHCLASCQVPLLEWTPRYQELLWAKVLAESGCYFFSLPGPVPDKWQYLFVVILGYLSYYV